MKQFYLYIFLCLILASCDDYTEHKPFDIIKGNEDMQAEYYKKTFKNPALISGTVIDKKTKKPIAKAKVTLHLQGSKTYYNSICQDDGTFSIYGERGANYSLYAEMNGYVKNYLLTINQLTTDTTFFLNDREDIQIALRQPSNIPAITLKYLSKVATPINYPGDLAFNGVNLVALDYGYGQILYFDANGKQIDYLGIWNSYYSIGCNGTKSFYATTKNNSMIYVYSSSDGSLTSSFSTDVSPVNDVENFNNKLWIVDKTKLYQMSLGGRTESSLDFNDNFDAPTILGLTQKGNFLYVLIDDNYDYTLCKIDPATLKVVGSGVLPDQMSEKALTGIAFDKVNLWTLDSDTSEIIKLSVSE